MSELFDRLRDVNRQNTLDAAEAVLRYEEGSKARLLGILLKKGKTMFIGSIAQMEKFFGFLWGHGLKQEECSPEQLAMRPVWDMCRTEILNNGNKQLRAIEQEIEQYTLSWVRYNTILKEQDNG